ncbi:RelA/SpoT family protein [Oceanirhabdus sp. W0125-5]|uniref:RelA/SpoT family protein n=1 Tax=Oceanirhabdus sp. W0125-5 TaxID=2999116 RepID=UPI0022F32461|nr:bifunctional (p)ppGpp synthetase/guanosine-3',5'-bis(diphosphate) 3'-pyrophosphohydrolase [Oceanirhabdus sp. W0125-5]WBW99537.1 bifunctional (p)ppGpp synthetase/guanosine-3',5'-bis(diphosphate) 3'-pyrophosphohydrolase [Oceanirhabdus sp. W0125-5]
MLIKLFNILDENGSNINKKFIEKAFRFANDAHENQRRKSGELYITHPLEVACILAEMNLDENTIAAALLHDVVEDTHYTFDDVKVEFNEEVAILVDGVTKLEKIKYKSKEEEQADNVRKMVLAMAKDIRVILIKLADRLHNMRTLKYMPIEKQKEKAKEAIDIYAPLAHRLGISKIKWELEDLSLRYLDPNEYYNLVRKIAEKRAGRELYINSIIEELSDKLSLAGIESEIEGRPKHFYSIYRKMKNKNKSLDQIFDLTALRILVEDVGSCYAALGIVHTLYKPIPGRFKDYIAMPKPNMYQSIHTTVIGPQGKPFEIQIRTWEMHKTAEYGIAAHWKYKEGQTENGEDKFETKLTWLRDILEWQGETSDAAEFMDSFKIDLFSDEVFVFTPKGDVINLPSESTPVDFAYRIHTDIGHRCVGAKVNSKIVPIDYKLKTGQIVEVIASPGMKAPSRGWLAFVKSNQAKSKIKAWFRRELREENIRVGKEMLEKECKKMKVVLYELLIEENIEKLFKRFNIKTFEDLFAEIGSGEILVDYVFNKISDLIKANKEKLTIEEEQERISALLKKGNKTDNENQELVIKGADNLMVRFAKCCNPVPGDDVIGYVTKGRGISIHRKDCKNVSNLLKTEGEKIIDVNWGKIESKEFISEIEMKSVNRDGILADVMECVVKYKTPVCSINAVTQSDGIALINLKIRVNSTEHIRNVIKRLRKIDGILEIYRLKK